MRELSSKGVKDLYRVNTEDLTSILCDFLQGDQSACSKPPVDIDLKVVF